MEEQKSSVSTMLAIGALVVGIGAGLLGGYFYSSTRFTEGYNTGYSAGLSKGTADGKAMAEADAKAKADAEAKAAAEKAAASVNPFSGSSNPLGSDYQNPYDTAAVNPFK